jgi:hypothetical protein
LTLPKLGKQSRTQEREIMEQSMQQISNNILSYDQHVDIKIKS